MTRPCRNGQKIPHFPWKLGKFVAQELSYFKKLWRFLVLCIKLFCSSSVVLPKSIFAHSIFVLGWTYFP